MKPYFHVFCLLAAAFGCVVGRAEVWQPSPGHRQIPLWPGSPPDAQPLPGPEYAVTRTSRRPQFAGKSVTGIRNVSQPTMTVFAPQVKSSGAAVVVFPGGGFQVLAIDLEGTEACRWLTSLGVTCVLVKYRVPSAPYRWQCKCYPKGDLAESVPALEDAERTVRLVRSHAGAWHIDPHKVGVLGFSAGGFLVAELSTDFNRRLYVPVDAADEESCRPDFALAIYPGHLQNDGTLNPLLTISRDTPPTFLVQAEDDYVDGVGQSLVYYSALAKAHVPAELHIYPKGGHAFGLRTTNLPITHWPGLAAAWLHRIGVIGN